MTSGSDEANSVAVSAMMECGVTRVTTERRGGAAALRPVAAAQTAAETDSETETDAETEAGRVAAGRCSASFQLPPRTSRCTRRRRHCAGRGDPRRRHAEAERRVEDRRRRPLPQSGHVNDPHPHAISHHHTLLIAAAAAPSSLHIAHSRRDTQRVDSKALLRLASLFSD
jgi:hypothetical protein